LHAARIASAIYFPRPLHLVKAFESLGGREGQFPVAEMACRNLLALPLHPWLSDADVQSVCAAAADAVTAIP
jgi:UDP-2-acetamido-2-deoxy-ribo-hexuluronate aminotransferase